MRLVIFFGTESGTAEFVSNDLAAKLQSTFDVVTCDLAEFALGDFDTSNFYLIVCSTYGDGDPPFSARPFLASLQRETPDLTGVKFAVFGMGDSSYKETYGRGSEVVAQALERLGAVRVGPYGRHDASGRDDASDAALTWVDEIVPLAAAHSENA
jgi:MioC protein